MHFSRKKASTMVNFQKDFYFSIVMRIVLELPPKNIWWKAHSMQKKMMAL